MHFTNDPCRLKIKLQPSVVYYNWRNNTVPIREEGIRAAATRDRINAGARQPTTAFLGAVGLRDPVPWLSAGVIERSALDQAKRGSTKELGEGQFNPDHCGQPETSNRRLDARLGRLGGGATQARTLLDVPNTSFTVSKNSSAV